MSRLHISMLTTGFPRFQGDLFGTFILELARELVEADCTVEVLAPHQAGLAADECFGNVKVHRFRYFWPARAQRVAYGGGIPTNLRRSWLARLQVPFFLLGFWFGALRRVRRGGLVHCHWTISGLIAYWATRWWRCPLVLSVRGSDIHLVGSGMMAQLHRLIYNWMDVVVAVSEDIAANLEALGVPKSKIKVVANGVDRRFQPADCRVMRERLGLPDEEFIMLFVGLLVPVKGLDVLVESLAELADPKPLCLLVGDGPERPELERQAVQLGVSDRLRFAGRRSSDEIPTWMGAADILVLPSRSEGRPNVVLEAQACGLPVVATRVGGTPELVCDGKTGLLVESEDVADLADALQRLRIDRGLREALGRAGREQADGMTWAVSAEKMAAIYRDLLEVA